MTDYKRTTPTIQDTKGETVPEHVVDWALEETKAKRKLDILIMPILTLGFFCLQLDRGNMANAVTNNFMEDVDINQDQFNVGQQMLSLGIVLTEIPSNMILYRRGYGAFIVTRFLLGITESGFIPGGLWTLSTCAKLLAYGILHMRGVGGQNGWFWLFALMGSFTVLSGFIFGFFLLDSFKNPHSTFLPKVSRFIERELHILQTRVLLDDPMKGKKKRKIGLGAFKRTSASWRIWVHFLITLSNNGPQRAFDTYAPLIITSFGFGSLVSNATAAAGLFLQVPVSFAFSWVSDHYNRRGETVMLGFFCHLLGYIFNRTFTAVNLRGVRYFGVVWRQTFGTFSYPLNIAWLSLNCEDSEQRHSQWLVIMNANIAGIYGAQIFRSDDKPLYRRGFSVALSVLAVGLVLAIVRYAETIVQRRRKLQAVEVLAS
ncbi:major facilitator superfamily domain-containing protein [Aspergillus fruticulosus]